MTQLNLLGLIDMEENTFNSIYKDMDLSLITIENEVLSEKIDLYFLLLDNIRQHAYSGSNRQVLKLLVISQQIRKKLFS
ncbi:hypothetical protein [Formosa sp. PL04]|uniref:hypothetical protein n=1 Tax=Formosa sp. PL04 TaxID=3081755 RepID=UPI0029829841|nr:hypothetical protein [Formosa sp. PL04]MDW5288585.1 hypothetical protein [Formosa sp. PL04]